MLLGGVTYGSGGRLQVTAYAVKEVKEGASRIGEYFRSLGIWVPVSICLIWAAQIPKVVPSLSIDRGILVSVAERLLAGDVLYRDVWDNKDPLFYYSVAVGRMVSPYADFAIEILWIACASAAVFKIAQWRGCDSRTTLFLALGIAPLILTGGLYYPGFTHLPGIAVTLAIIATALYRRYGIAGALMGVLLFLKIVMVPIAILMLLAVVAIRRSWGAAIPASVGFLLASGAVVLPMVARGEFVPYLQSLALNVSYAEGSLTVGPWGPLVERMIRMKSWAAIGALVAMAFAFAWLVVVNLRQGRRWSRDDRNVILLACAGLSLISSFVVLGLTGLWPHHVQVLYVPAVLGAVALIHGLQPVFNVKKIVPVAAFVIIAVMLSGPETPSKYIGIVKAAPKSLADLGKVSPEARAILSVGPSGTYARIGQNDDGGHAFGLGNWKLACPRFDQYPFDSPQALNAVAECLPKAEVVLVSPSAMPAAGNAAWNSFLDRVDGTLRADYSCKQSAAGRLCLRN